MNKQTEEALKMAIEALAEFEWIKDSKYQKAINACKEALEQLASPEKTTSLEDVIKEFEKDPEMKALLDLARKQVKGMELEQPKQEPVAWQYEMDGHTCWTKTPHNGCIPLYNHPHQWQGLTDDEILKASSYIDMLGSIDDDDVIKFAHAIEQALKEKNNG